MMSHISMSVHINQQLSIMRLFEPTLSGTIFRGGCCRKTQLCEQDDTECRLPISISICVVGQDIKFANNFNTSW